MSNVTNLFPCKWSSRDVQFATNIIQVLIDKFEQRDFREAAEIARGYIAVIQMMEETPR
jgi:hypothetical protein